ncbi:hypothetical protein LUZ60_000080 [Juncus effusus]|nr:hypothetical protein LUZ60_000080 [Juncus effusus]
MQIRASKHFFSTLRAHLNRSKNNPSHFLYVPLAYLSSNNPRRPFRGRRDEESSEDGKFLRGERQRENVNPDDFFPEMGKNRDLGGKNQRIEGEGKDKGRFGDSSESEGEELRSSPQFQSSDPQFDGENKKNEKVKPLSTIGESLFEKLKLGDKKDESQPTRVETNDFSPPHQPPQEADEIFRKMKETGLIPNAVSMLDGLCKDGLVHEAMKLFSLMREKGTIPEVVIYTAVVDGFCKAGKCEDGKRIFRKMQKNGVIPNAYSYNVIIQWLCSYNLLDDCVEFCEEMFEAGHVLNAESFVKVVDKVCKVKGREEGERIVRGFEKRNFAIDEKSIREYLDKKGPFDSSVEEVIFGKRGSRGSF